MSMRQRSVLPPVFGSRKAVTPPRARKAAQRFVRPLKLFSWLLLVTLLCATPVRAKWIFDIRSGVLYDSNVSRSDRSGDVEEGLAWRTFVAAGQQFQLTDDLRLGLFAETEARVWQTYDGLDSVAPAFAPNLRYRFGLGKNAPWLRLETKVGYADFAEARRSGWDARAGVRGGFSLSDRLALEAGYLFSDFAARDTVFCLQAHALSVRGSLELTSSTRLALGYEYRYGDVNSHAVPPRPEIVAIADALIPVNTFDELRTAYRFEASTHSGSVALSQALGSFAAVQARYVFEYTTHDPVQYTNHVAELAIAFSF